MILEFLDGSMSSEPWHHVGLPQERISRCLRTVELALGRSNLEEAMAAVERAFAPLEDERDVTAETPLADLGINVRTVNGLEEAGLLTVGDLVKCTREDLQSLPNFGLRTVTVIESVLQRHGFGIKARR